MRTSFVSLVKRFAREEKGASLVEYAVLIGLVTVVLVGAIGLMGDQIKTAFDNITATLTASNAKL
jgi:pilus assembly protein Flp/PilA